MRKVFLLGLGLWLATFPAVAAPAPKQPTYRVVGTAVSSQDVTEIVTLLNELVSASNRHDSETILKHYSPRFVSGDNLNLDQLRQLIEDTWKMYPDIRYESIPLEIRFNGDWATVETLDTSKATARMDASANKPLGPMQTGLMTSRSRGMLYLKRVGKTWEVQSDNTLYETATISYGDASKLNVQLSAPDQVFAGEPYSAKVSVDMPEVGFAIASIAKDVLVFPQRQPDEKFRSLTAENTQLERVFDANQTNHNEMITVTIGLTQVGQDAQNRPSVKLDGITTVVKRVNVLPKSRLASENDSPMVNTSARGEGSVSPNAKEPHTP